MLGSANQSGTQVSWHGDFYPDVRRFANHLITVEASPKGQARKLALTPRGVLPSNMSFSTWSGQTTWCSSHLALLELLIAISRGDLRTVQKHKCKFMRTALQACTIGSCLKMLPVPYQLDMLRARIYNNWSPRKKDLQGPLKAWLIRCVVLSVEASAS